MKPFIILWGNKYYPRGWDDYIGEADTIDEAVPLALSRDKEEGDRSEQYTWWEIVDLRIKQVVLTRNSEDPPYDPRSS